MCDPHNHQQREKTMHSIQEILAALARKELTQDEAAALLANPPKRPKGITLEVSAKGAVKIKGMRARWPIVLYPNEVQTILGMADQFIDFIEANKAKLSFHKGQLDTEAAPGEVVGESEAA